MPKKNLTPTVEQARKRLEQAIRRLVVASVDRSSAGTYAPADREHLIRDVREAKVNVTWAIQDFEAAVRREYDNPDQVYVRLTDPKE